MLWIFAAAGALKFTGSAEPTISSRDLPDPPFSGVTWMTAKSYEAPSPPVSPPCSIHWSEVCAQSPHQTPYGATSSREAFANSAADRASLLYDGTNAMFRYQPPSLPACTQWPAVHTMLDLPGLAGSCTTVAEQTIVPSGESKNTLPATGTLSWYVADTALASTGAGSGSVTPWSPEMSLSSTPL